LYGKGVILNMTAEIQNLNNGKWVILIKPYDNLKSVDTNDEEKNFIMALVNPLEAWVQGAYIIVGVKD
jgi:hypothetical protein